MSPTIKIEVAPADAEAAADLGLLLAAAGFRAAVAPAHLVVDLSWLTGFDAGRLLLIAQVLERLQPDGLAARARLADEVDARLHVALAEHLGGAQAAADRAIERAKRDEPPTVH
jgi:hypothetical protein